MVSDSVHEVDRCALNGVILPIVDPLVQKRARDLISKKGPLIKGVKHIAFILLFVISIPPSRPQQRHSMELVPRLKTLFGLRSCLSHLVQPLDLIDVLN